jgi:hypothetical protein
MECVRVIERVTKFNPRGVYEQSRRAVALRPWQENRNDTKALLIVANPAIDRQAHLLRLPWPYPLTANEYRATFAFLKGIFDRRFPISGAQ